MLVNATGISSLAGNANFFNNPLYCIDIKSPYTGTCCGDTVMDGYESCDNTAIDSCKRCVACSNPIYTGHCACTGCSACNYFTGECFDADYSNVYTSSEETEVIISSVELTTQQTTIEPPCDAITCWCDDCADTDLLRFNIRLVLEVSLVNVQNIDSINMAPFKSSFLQRMNDAEASVDISLTRIQKREVGSAQVVLIANSTDYVSLSRVSTEASTDPLLYSKRYIPIPYTYISIFENTSVEPVNATLIELSFSTSREAIASEDTGNNMMPIIIIIIAVVSFIVVTIAVIGLTILCSAKFETRTLKDPM